MIGKNNDAPTMAKKYRGFGDKLKIFSFD